MSTKEGTFLVTHADDESATLRDVADSQVLTLSENPGLDAGSVVDATVEPEPPMEVTYTVVELDAERTIPVERVEFEPTAQATDIAADQPVGDLTTRERAGEGEIHVLTVPEEDTEDAATEVVEDEATVSRAARLGVDRVEVRTAAGVVSVRYLPD
ncbi:DUF5812 family protein [Halomicroarcula sp. S1AR25-4]|uniref:DUF5812 family protein n=1 Tax=Haloarcula sp. S1AR25-4 TaxID=2950538 RepID=UPI00287476D6|nr:DUF5812 family protein [Halomicroarcula sp. S1AR25-4]MDS0278548.1 DUF5812 family protein [Halomicroarcula sp. S1AR25-4]